MSPKSQRDFLLEMCPNKAQHTPQPEDYLEWHDWAEKMTKTHRQIRCGGCKLWAIWVPKHSRETVDRAFRSVPQQ